MKPSYQILILVFFITSSIREEQHTAKFIQDTIVSYERGTYFLKLEGEHNFKLFMSLLNDPGKHKYKPILPVMESFNQGFSQLDSIQHATPKLKTKEIFVKLSRIFKGQKEAYQKLLEANGKRFGLKSDEIRECMARMDRVYDTFNAQNYQWDKNIALRNAKLEFDLTTVQNIVLSQLMELAGGRTIKCFAQVTPRIQPRKNFIRRGERFEAAIWISPADFNFYPEDLRLYINGEHYPFEEDSWLVHIAMPVDEPQKTLTITGELQDVLTGKWQELFEAFEYTIDTIEP